MISLSRTDNSVLSTWWWEVDRVLLIFILMLAGIGLWLTFSASPAVAEKYGYDSFHYVMRQSLFLGMGLLVMLVVSMLPVTLIKRAAILIFPLCLGLLVLTLLIGPEVKGAQRWLRIAGFGLQPSEFTKPIFFIVIAWVLSAKSYDVTIPAKRMATGLFMGVACLLVMQPDFGQTMLMGIVFVGQMIIAGLSFTWVGLAFIAAIVLLFFGYMFVPHVTHRIDKFIDPKSGDNFQTQKALEALKEGGMMGKGPGEGTVKINLPDAHTDYIFAVLGEEFGVIACMILLLIIAVIAIRAYANFMQEPESFNRLVIAGLMLQFLIQSSINIAVNLNLMPSKGMTLPFVSYGGSSMLALAFGMGVLLAFTRRPRSDRLRAIGDD